MVTWCCYYWNSAVNPIWAFMPLPPLGITVLSIHQITRMKCKGCSRSIAKGFSKNSWPMRPYFILSIPKIYKTERFVVFGCSLEMIIFCKIHTITDAICIKCVRLQISKNYSMIMRIIEISLEKSCLCSERLWFQCSTIRICSSQLRHALLYGGIGSPRDRLSGCRIFLPC